MTNTSLSCEMRSLISRVQAQKNLTSFDKQTLLKTLGLAEKYLKQENLNEENNTATSETPKQELDKQKFTRIEKKQREEIEVPKKQSKDQQNTSKTNMILEREQDCQKTRIDFQYFFATLHNHQESNHIKNNQNSYQHNEESCSISYEKGMNSRKKGLNDREWRRFKKSEFENENNVRRKSLRIEQIHDKQRLEAEMEELRVFYNCAKYRYNDLFVRLRVCYLKANCLKYQDYDELRTATIPDLSEERSAYSDLKINKIVEKKKLGLLKRMQTKKNDF